MNLGTHKFPGMRGGHGRGKGGEFHYPWDMAEPGDFFLILTAKERWQYRSHNGCVARRAIRSSACQFRRKYAPAARFLIEWRASRILLVERVA